jgi:hypothetical protein
LSDFFKALLVTTKGNQEKDFKLLTEAVVWLSREFAAGDGFAVYGEIRFLGELRWRRGRLPDQG